MGDKFYGPMSSGHWPPDDSRYLFFCPGCQCGHYVRVAGPGPQWAFNQNKVKPTVSPSILVSSTHTCHSFIKDGMIQFLDDCTHALKGQTVELPDWDS